MFLNGDYQLSRNGETIALFTPAGLLMDSVTFGPQTSDISEGRWPDGQEAPFRSLPVPTPKIANTGSTAPVLRVLSITTAPGSITIAFQSEPGKRYQLQSKDDLTATEWIPMGGTIQATGAQTSTTDHTSAPNRQRYYRVIQVP